MTTYKAAGVAAVALAIGCSPEFEYAEVDGRITLDGKPLAGVLVQFLIDPDAGKYAPLTIAVSGDDGRFRPVASTGAGGAVPGVYIVVVQEVPADPAEKKRPAARKPPIPPAYTAMATTPLRGIVVRPGGQALTLELVSN